MWKPMTDDSNTACGACLSHGLGTLCGICFSPCRSVSLPCSTAFTPPATRPHAFCAPCIGKYCAYKIEEGVGHLTCPEPGCDHTITEKMRKGLLNRGLLSAAQIQRLKELQNVTRIDRLREIFLSSDDLLYEALVDTCQACPHCYMVTQRYAGCSHMTCSCGGEYCWTCGEAYPLASNHPTASAIPHGQNAPPRLSPHDTCSALELQEASRRRAAREAGGELPNDISYEWHARPPPASSTAPIMSKEGVLAELMNHVLVLRCPNNQCQHAVLMDASFDACFSLQCARCSSHFCAWCLRMPSFDPCGPDPHSHVLDCTQAPADMRGSALYLHDGNGGPHVPPNPHRKFTHHWASRLRARAEAFLQSFGPNTEPAGTNEVDPSASQACLPCSTAGSASDEVETATSPEAPVRFTLAADEVDELLGRVDAWLSGWGSGAAQPGDQAA